MFPYHKNEAQTEDDDQLAKRLRIVSGHTFRVAVKGIGVDNFVVLALQVIRT